MNVQITPQPIAFGITTGANGGDCVFLRVKEEGSEECLALWNVDAQSDRRERDGGALMDRLRSAGYFEDRRMCLMASFQRPPRGVPSMR
jgi:hypothetical protein